MSSLLGLPLGDFRQFRICMFLSVVILWQCVQMTLTQWSPVILCSSVICVSSQRTMCVCCHVLFNSEPVLWNLFTIQQPVDFRGTETPGNHILNFLWIFHMICSLYKFPKWKSSVLKCTAYSWIKEKCTTLCFAYVFDRQEIKWDCDRDIRWCSVPYTWR